MTPEEQAFFPPQTLPLYEALCEKLLQINPDTRFEVKRTQVSLRCGLLYGATSLPRSRRDLQAGALLLTFGLPYHVNDARVWQASEPYTGRWTHHVLLHSASELDAQLLGWLREACAFAGRSKR